MNNNTFYVTTPIYYVNDKPHIGHAYTTVLADVLARCHRAAGHDTWFLTGTDEHGQKVEKAAKENGITPLEQCDRTVIRFQELWKRLGISNNDFIRTTEKRHTEKVQAVLQDLYDRDLIYRNEYHGHYCVPCERFFTEKDLVDGLCPECKRPVDPIVESNYFFRMSKYQDALIEYIKTHHDFIQPAFRANETLGFLKKPLGDLCISRPKSRVAWGIELPFDKDYVCYVWFDALLNYATAIGYLSDDSNFRHYWESCIHLIGKDILTTHSVYWPTMLMAMNLPLPKTIFAHGWWLIRGDKMSKSVGNVVNPMDIADKYGVDPFRYFLLAEMTPGSDASFSEDTFASRFDRDLANDLGNMVSRVVKSIVKNCNGELPAPSVLDENDKKLLRQSTDSIRLFEENLNEMKLDRGIMAVMDVIHEANRYIEDNAPWALAKAGNTERLGTVLYVSTCVLSTASGLLSPIMPQKMAELRAAIGLSEDDVVKTDFASLRDFHQVKPGSKVLDIPPLFPRIKVKSDKNECAVPVAKSKQTPPKTKKVEEEPLPEGVISFAEFGKTKLRTAKVLEADRIPGSEKLLKLKIELGSEQRPLVAGIAKYYTPEDIIGKTIVVVSNLAPAKIFGYESQGMLLAAKSGDELKLVTVDGGIFPSGSSVG